MYHDFAGREIEDAEMDAMLQETDYINAREAAKVTVEVTGEMIHNAYAKVYTTAIDYLYLSQEQVNNYRLMAEYLNDALKLAAATQESGHVWSAEEE